MYNNNPNLHLHQNGNMAIPQYQPPQYQPPQNQLQPMMMMATTMLPNNNNTVTPTSTSSHLHHHSSYHQNRNHQRIQKYNELRSNAQATKDFNNTDPKLFSNMELIFESLRDEAKIGLINFFFGSPSATNEANNNTCNNDKNTTSMMKFLSKTILTNYSSRQSTATTTSDECSNENARFMHLGESWLSMLIAESLTIQQKSICQVEEKTESFEPAMSNTNHHHNRHHHSYDKHGTANRRYIHSNKNDDNDITTTSITTNGRWHRVLKTELEEEKAKSLKFSMTTKLVLGQFVASVLSLHLDEVKERREREDRKNNENFSSFNDHNNHNSHNIEQIFFQIFKSKAELKREKQQEEYEKLQKLKEQQQQEQQNVSDVKNIAGTTGGDTFLNEILQLSEEANKITAVTQNVAEDDDDTTNSAKKIIEYDINDNDDEEESKFPTDQRKERSIIKKRRQIRILGDLFCLCLYLSAHLNSTPSDQHGDVKNDADDDIPSNIFGDNEDNDNENQETSQTNKLLFTPSASGIERSRKCFLAFKRWFLLTSEKQEMDKVNNNNHHHHNARNNNNKTRKEDFWSQNDPQNIILSNSHFKENKVLPSNIVDANTKLFIILNPQDYGIDELSLMPTMAENGGGFALVGDYSHLACFSSAVGSPTISTTTNTNTQPEKQQQNINFPASATSTKTGTTDRFDLSGVATEIIIQRTETSPSSSLQIGRESGQRRQRCEEENEAAEQQEEQEQQVVPDQEERHCRPAIKIFFTDTSNNSNESSVTKQFHPCCGLLETNMTKPCVLKEKMKQKNEEERSRKQQKPSEEVKYHPGDVIEGPSSKFPLCFAHWSCCKKPLVGPPPPASSSSTNTTTTAKYQIHPEFVGGCKRK